MSKAGKFNIHILKGATAAHGSPLEDKKKRTHKTPRFHKSVSGTLCGILLNNYLRRTSLSTKVIYWHKCQFRKPTWWLNFGRVFSSNI